MKYVEERMVKKLTEPQCPMEYQSLLKNKGVGDIWQNNGHQFLKIWYENYKPTDPTNTKQDTHTHSPHQGTA